MHELGIVFHIIKTVEKVGAENALTKVSSVTLELGEVSGVVEDYLRDCWKWAVSRSELMRDCRLKVETIPAVTFCEDCRQNYETVRHGRVCPYCKSGRTRLVTGNEMNIKEIVAFLQAH